RGGGPAGLLDGEMAGDREEGVAARLEPLDRGEIGTSQLDRRQRARADAPRGFEQRELGRIAFRGFALRERRTEAGRGDDRRDTGESLAAVDATEPHRVSPAGTCRRAGSCR